MSGAGDLRERVKIRRMSTAKNQQTGGLKQGLADVATVAAEVKSMDGREAMLGSVLQGVAHFQIRIRYRTDIKPSDQLRWRNRDLNVHSAEDREGRRRWTWIHASTEGVLK
jgi:SPP1 family predicted phage head-tail adaptor